MTYLFTAGSIIDGLINILVGMGTVFIALILISLIISCFVFIPKLTAAFSRNDKEELISQSETNQDISEQTDNEIVYEELADDQELVAVITAAIMAYNGDEACSDGLTVRSIRRVRTR